jgi:hypothetical protein
MSSQNQKYNQTRHQFLLTLFPNNEKQYAVLHMNGFVLVRQFSGNTHRWEVAIYTQESYRKVQYWKDTRARAGVDEPNQPHQHDLEA